MLTAYAHFSAPNKSSFDIRLLMSVQRQVGSPNQAWAGPVERVLSKSMLLVQTSCLAFLKICLKIHFCTSNTLRALTLSLAQVRFGLPTWR